MYRKGAPIIGWSPRFIPALAMFHFALSAVRVCDWVIYRARVLGREHLRGLPAAVVVSNHTLLFDPGIVAHAIRPRRTYFTMLEETALIPYLGTFVRLLGAVPIPEGPGSLRILDEAAGSAFSTFGLIHFFPEGELSLLNQQLQAFHPGAFLLACRRGVPVVPVTTVLHQRLWRGRSWVQVAGRRVRLPPRLTIVIGEPIYPREEDRRSPVRAARGMANRVRERMQDAIDRHGGCKTMGRGLMPRLVKRAEEQSA
ncbi:MAG TPA: lysophospholipid acyltransferase family protein [Spirochaetia bacterium]|nr:lysophospholipid acyltransferase family protein [Spirochaetia bacterium]